MATNLLGSLPHSTSKMQNIVVVTDQTLQSHESDFYVDIRVNTNSNHFFKKLDILYGIPLHFFEKQWSAVFYEVLRSHMLIPKVLVNDDHCLLFTSKGACERQRETIFARF